MSQENSVLEKSFIDLSKMKKGLMNDNKESETGRNWEVNSRKIGIGKFVF